MAGWMPGAPAAPQRETHRRRLALGAAIGILLVLAVVALVARRGEDAPAQGASTRPEPSGSVVTSLVAAPTSPSTTIVSSTTSAVPGAVPTTLPAPVAATVPPTVGTVGERVQGVAGAYGPVQAALTQARERWRASRPAGGYVWSYENECRCSPRGVEVAVDGAGAVTNVRSLGDAAAVLANDQGLSIDGALGQIQEAIDANAASISVRFDPARGLPNMYFIDRSQRKADEGRGLSLLTFTPRG